MLFHFKIGNQSLSHMALLVLGQHCQPCPGLTQEPVPPDLGEDTGKEGLLCPDKATPLLQLQLLPKVVSGNLLGATGWYCCPELFPLFR